MFCQGSEDTAVRLEHSAFIRKYSKTGGKATAREGGEKVVTVDRVEWSFDEQGTGGRYGSAWCAGCMAMIIPGNASLIPGSYKS